MPAAKLGADVMLFIPGTGAAIPGKIVKIFAGNVVNAIGFLPDGTTAPQLNLPYGTGWQEVDL